MVQQTGPILPCNALSAAVKRVVGVAVSLDLCLYVYWYWYVYWNWYVYWFVCTGMCLEMCSTHGCDVSYLVVKIVEGMIVAAATLDLCV